jgi:internalin A
MAEKTSNQVAQERIDNVLTTGNIELNLSSLGLTSLPPELNKLSHIQSLDLSYNHFAVFPIQIIKLTKLKILNLSVNNLTELPTEIGNLSNLQILDLHGNALKKLPQEIGNLIELQALNLNFTPITSVPSTISHLNNLKVLNLRKDPIGGLRLHDIPPEIGLLSNLEILDLYSNGIRKLPTGIFYLSKLKILDLRKNYLGFPPEIIEKVNEPKSILTFYAGLQGDKRRPLYEAKTIFIGQGGVGKTSLINQVIYGTFDPQENKTEGINIHRYKVRDEITVKTERPEKIQLNIWDFGGQEIMHATHQFFLTKRSLYILVLDARLTQEENRVEYWLKIINSFGDEPPILIVGNKIDQHPLDIDRTGLLRKYPNVLGVINTSAATGTGIEELKAAITEKVNDLPHVRDLLPETWFAIKTNLEGLGSQSNFITHDEYLELCIENEIRDEISQRTLIGFMHDLGVVLHFQEDPRLEALGILNPHWVTNGVYKILNSHTLFQNKGVLTISMLDRILDLPEYPRSKRFFIIDMMKKFELCYDIEKDKTFLVPDLLPKDEPFDLQFEGIPAFEYIYPVLPSSVITRFIVRMNQKIDNDIVWRTGILLKFGENYALVRADIEDRKITISVGGPDEARHTRRDALSAIRYQLDEIHGSIKGLDAQKRVPISNAPNAEPLEYDYLLMLEREGQETHLIKDGTRLVKVNIREILSGIESESQVKERGGNVTNIYVAGNVRGNIIAGDDNVAESSSDKLHPS